MSDSDFDRNNKYVIGLGAIKDTRALNDINNVGEVVTRRTVGNLGFIALALAGEAGEAANVVKKMWRDGVTPEKMDHLAEEMVDIVIYLCIMLDITNIDLYQAWTAKFNELNERFLLASPEKWLLDKPDRDLYEEIKRN
jgi:NTP pyrophosphatase (non-canonical NTP hydrolase)